MQTPAPSDDPAPSPAAAPPPQSYRPSEPPPISPPRASSTSPRPTELDPIRPPHPNTPGPIAPGADPQATMPAFDWLELERRQHQALGECGDVELEIVREFEAWVKVFQAWAATTSVQEPERAAKRLKTRINYVQGAEKRLEAKRLHYIRVVQAFQSALALMGAD